MAATISPKPRFSIAPVILAQLSPLEKPGELPIFSPHFLRFEEFPNRFPPRISDATLSHDSNAVVRVSSRYRALV
jgi:hypothetical protein